MTATPHNGKEEDFQLFLSLLDSDRFYGKFRDGVHKVDTSDLMRRMVKEELVKFDGTPLFPERKAYTVNYDALQIEAALYESVTTTCRPRWARPTSSTAPARARSASPHRAPAAPRVQPRGDLPVAQAPQERLESRLRERSSASRRHRCSPRPGETSPRTTTT
jgi:hypothetical protein